MDRRLQRYALQAAARELMPKEKVSKCLRWVVPNTGGVDVLYSPEVQKAHYRHLEICASVWMCPICSAKITERRRVELTEVLGKIDLDIVMVTFTLQHDDADSLKDSLDALSDSFRSLKQGRKWVQFTKDFQLVGFIRALEVTHGANGWHPHLHVLFFFRRGVDRARLEKFLKSHWLAMLDRNSASASWRRGVDVQKGNNDVADYIAKYGHEPIYLARSWGVEHELTKAPVKMARGAKGSTPLDLLAQYAFNPKKRVRRRAAALWVTYAKAFKGRRQLFWSHGLRKTLGLVKEQSDEDIAKREEKNAYLLATISFKNWRIILGNDARGELLEVASSGDKKQLNDFLLSIGCEYL